MTTDSGGATLPSENGLRAVLAIGVGAAAIALVFAPFIPRQRSPAQPAETPAPAGTPAGKPATDAQ